jgi:hypothetical protein
LRAFYDTAIAIARRDVAKRDRTAAIKALWRRLREAILAVTERRQQAVANRHAARRQKRPPRDPELTKQ